jgi:DMSO/TMAO reductase YedYZ molybdopterin-dependent catalytic subunit
MPEQEAPVKSRFIITVFILLALGTLLAAEARKKLDATTPAAEIITLDPKDVDPSGLPLTAVEAMHSTGTPQDVKLSDWRLGVTGPVVKKPLALSYDQLLRMTMVKKRAILICPGFFYDYLEWDGVTLADLLKMAGVASFTRVSFTSVDGYTSDFTKEEADAHLIMVAVRGNGVPLPRTQGFPARVVAEDLYGGRWVKYLKDIVVE